jgi:hypothetical protein
MNKLRRIIIRINIAVKLLLSTGMIMSIIAIGCQQMKFQVSGIPEHEDLLKEYEGVVLKLVFFIFPVIVSLVIDFKELKSNSLQNRWYLIAGIVVLNYIIIKSLNSHFIILVIEGFLGVGLLLVIFWQNKFSEKI